MDNITHVNVIFLGYVMHADRITFRAFYFSKAKNIVLVCVVVLNCKAAKVLFLTKKFGVN